MHVESETHGSRNVIRIGLVSLSLLAMSAFNAQAVDLVTHNGFEACWSQALTKPQFLGLMQSSFDNQTFCMQPQTLNLSGFPVTLCNTPACAGGQSGCPVTLHSGAFSGDASSGTFGGSGTADDVTVPVGGTLNCEVDVANIDATINPDYNVIADGNNGVYTASLTQAPVSLDGSQITFSTTDFGCQAALAGLGNTLVSQLETAVTAVAEAQLRAATLDKSICPLTP